MDITIRKYTASDVEPVIAITRDNMTPIIRREWGTEWNEEYECGFRNSLQAEGTILAAGTQGGTIAYVWYSPYLDDTEILINSIQVREAYQRRGIGTKIMEWVEREAVERAQKQIVLCVQTCNSPARSFYEKLGFSERLRSKAGILMGKSLSCISHK